MQEVDSTESRILVCAMIAMIDSVGHHPVRTQSGLQVLKQVRDELRRDMLKDCMAEHDVHFRHPCFAIEGNDVGESVFLQKPIERQILPRHQSLFDLQFGNSEGGAYFFL